MITDTASVRPERSTAGHAFEMISFRVAGMAVGFFTTIVTSRFLLPTGRGAYVLGLLTVTIAATVLGNATAVTYEIGRRRETVNAIVGKALVLSAVLGIAGIAVLLPLGVLVSPHRLSTVVLFALGLPLLLVSQSIGGALAPLGQLRLLNVVQFVAPSALLVGTVIAVVVFHLGVRGAAAAWLGTQALTAAVAIYGGRRLWLPVTRRALAHSGTAAFVTLGVRAGIVNLVALVNYRVELMLLELFHGLHSVGIYSVAVSLAEMLWLVSGTLSAVTVRPALDAATERESAQIVARALRHTLILTASLGICLGGAGAVFIPLVFGQPFRGSIVPLLILIPGAVAYAPASVLSAFFSMRLGRLRYPLIVAGISATTTAVACLGLVPWLGVDGAAIASTLGYATGSAVLCVLFVRAGGVPLRLVIPTAADIGVYRELPALARKRFA